MPADILNCTNQGIIITDKDLQVCFWNAWMADVTGTAVSDAPGKPIEELLPGLGDTNFRLDAKIARATDDTSIQPIVVSMSGKEKTISYLELCGDYMLAETIVGKDDIIPDATGDHVFVFRVRSADLRPSQAPVPDLVARLRYDYITKLNQHMDVPLRSLTELVDLLEGTSLTENQRRYIKGLRQASGSLTSFMEEIADLASFEAGHVKVEPAVIAMDELFSDVLHLYDPIARQKGVLVLLNIEKTVPEKLVCDGHKVQQLLINLLSNAFKFTDQGKVELNVWMSGNQQNPALCFEVRDTGIGMSPDRLESLFGSQSDITHLFGADNGYQGGLGLPICRAISDLLDGRIDVESTLGKGSTFKVELPVSLECTGVATTGGQACPPNGRSDYGHWQVLLVGADPLHQRRVADMLGCLGCTFAFATSDKEAVAALQMSGPFDIVLIDMGSADRDGQAVATRIRSLVTPGNRTPILALTKHAQIGDLERFMDSGMDGFVTLPTTSSRLQHAITRALHPSVHSKHYAPRPPAPPAPREEFATYRQRKGSTSEAGRSRTLLERIAPWIR